MKSSGQTEQGGDRAESNDSDTLQTSQADQARGYLESLSDNDFMGEIQSALENAQRLTKQHWTVVVTADNVEIRCQDASRRIKLPKPNELNH
jgi:hypothetical protein